MTKERRKILIRHLKYSLEIGADCDITDEDAIEIIKALEQASALGKIRSEIEFIYDTIPWRNTECDGWVEALEWVLDVIDKYREEREIINETNT